MMVLILIVILLQTRERQQAINSQSVNVEFGRSPKSKTRKLISRIIVINGRLEYEYVTPIVWSKLLNCAKNRTAGHMLSNNGLSLRSMYSTCYYF